MRALASLLLLSLCLPLAAHEQPLTQALAQQHQWQAELALSYLESDPQWARTGAAPGLSLSDKRAWSGYGSQLSWSALWSEQLSSELSAAYSDDSNSLELEHTKLSWRSHSGPQFSLGQMSPALYRSLSAAWAWPSLSFELLFGGQHLHERGLEISASHGAASWQGGAYQGSSYPGGGNGDIGLWALSGQWASWPWQLSAQLGYWPDVRRLINAGGDGHSHTHANAPTGCGVVATCLDGHAGFLQLGVAYEAENWSSSAEFTERQESGQVLSANGDQRYDSRALGLLLQVQTRLAPWPQWHIGARSQWLKFQESLRGANADLVATTMGLDQRPSDAARHGLRLSFEPANAPYDFALEFYRDATEPTTTGLLTQWRYRWGRR